MSEWIEILFPIGIFIVITVGSLVLYGFLGFSVFSVIKNILACTWPKVDGKILDIKVKEEPGDELTIYSPIIEYEYIINQKNTDQISLHTDLLLTVLFQMQKISVKDFLLVR